MPSSPGTYALVLACTRVGRVRVGCRGFLDLRPGFYVYVGSAFGPGGLRARIAHHRRIAARPHWHIDYLRRRARLDSVWCRAGTRCEHAWAAQIQNMPGASVALPGFGSSDCRCETHLFWFASAPPISGTCRA
jgi:Uri superfamily endonuclease